MTRGRGGIRRHDAAVALLTRGEFGCDCGDRDCAAVASAGVVAERFAQIVVHVVADGATLAGDADTAGFLDGFGVIDAHHVREIAARGDAVTRRLDVAGLAGGAVQAGNPYRPTAACSVAVRAVFGTCCEPGCEKAAFRCDVVRSRAANQWLLPDLGSIRPVSLSGRRRAPRPGTLTG